MKPDENYEFDSSARVYMRKERKNFAYSDGDKTEQRLGEILAQVHDRSVLSDELKQLQRDWPSVYYFSAARSNLLWPFADALKGARVLELGCGLGAITRFLGENAAEVVAVEGSLRRGSIAAIRCADLENVTILIDDIMDLPESLGKFDFVTLIGVLEYACRFGGKGAELELLKKAHSFLKPEGALILAIENKLGLKYLAGVPEDHIPRPWLGVTNGYAEAGVKTWSRLELVRLLEKAGFQEIEQFLALPDYKLPITIVAPAGLGDTSGRLNLASLASRRIFEAQPVFNTAAAWASVVNAGLAPDLADSLCFVARPQAGLLSPFSADTLVFHYGNVSFLPACYSKETRIVADGNQLAVRRKRLSETAQEPGGRITQVLSDEPYLEGELLLEQIRRVAMKPDWTLDEFFDAFEPWAATLRENADASLRCDGDMLDFMPFNIIMRDGKPMAFDQEWVSRDRVLLPYLLFRGLYNTLVRIMPLRASSRHNAGTFRELFEAFLKRQNLPPDSPTSPDYLRWQEEKLFRSLRPYAKSGPPRDIPIQYMGALN